MNIQVEAYIIGRLKVFEDVLEGFENLPAALIGLQHEKNRGKRMVKIG
jgi:hypothetical protein